MLDCPARTDRFRAAAARMRRLLAVSVLVSLGFTVPARSHSSQQTRADTVRVSRATLALALDSVAVCRPRDSRGVWQTPPRVVQASRVHILPNGTIGMVDIREGKLFVWSRDGRELAVLGRTGRGPGEFAQAARLTAWPGDTLAVGDVQLARISLWTETGHARAISLAEQPRIANAAALGAMRDGTIIFGPGVSGPPVERSGPVQLYNTHLAWRPGFGAPYALGDSIRLAEYYVVVADGRRVQIEVNFGRRTWTAVLASTIARYDNHDQTIKLLDAQGDTKRIIYLDIADVRISQAERDSVTRAKAGILQRAPVFAEAVRHFPQFRSAVTSFDGDAQDGMWISVSPQAGRGAGAVYIRLTDAGTLDRCFRPTGEERVLGLSRDYIAVATSEADGDVIQLFRTVVLPAR